MQGNKILKEIRVRLRYRVCKRCKQFYLSSAKRGKVCDNCNMAPRMVKQRNFGQELKNIKKTSPTPLKIEINHIS